MRTATKAEYEIDDEVIALTGTFAGQVGAIDELDPGDPARPYRVRFDLPGEPVAWYATDGIKRTGQKVTW